jgi:hypothetical protein
MTVSITQINTSADTFQTWVTKTNDVIAAMAANVMTIAATSTGGVTTGNAYANGIFAANTIAAVTTLRGGTVSTSANLSITSNVHISGANLSSNAAALNLALSSYANIATETITFASNNFTVSGNTNLRSNTLTITTGGRVGVNTGSATAALDVVGTFSVSSGNATINSNTSLNSNTTIAANTTIRNGGTTSGYLWLGDQSGGARGVNYDGTKYNFLTANVNLTGTLVCPTIVKSGSANVTVDSVDVAAFKNAYDTRSILRVFDVNGTQVFSM